MLPSFSPERFVYAFSQLLTEVCTSKQPHQKAEEAGKHFPSQPLNGTVAISHIFHITHFSDKTKSLSLPWEGFVNTSRTPTSVTPTPNYLPLGVAYICILKSTLITENKEMVLNRCVSTFNDCQCKENMQKHSVVCFSLKRLVYMLDVPTFSGLWIRPLVILHLGAKGEMSSPLDT